MRNLKHLLKRPLNRVSTKLAIIILLIALVGFADSAYLTIERFRGVVPSCTIAGCDTVLTSAYSAIAEVPVSLFGAIYYLFIAVGSFIYLEARHGGGETKAHHSLIFKWTLVATVIGLAASVWFVFVQAAVLRAFCQYCLLSALTSTALFVMALIIFSKNEDL